MNPSILIQSMSLLTVAICLQAFAGDPEVIRITTQDSKVRMGELTAESATEIDFFDIVALDEVRVPRVEITQIDRLVTMNEVTAFAGISNTLSWKLRTLGAGAFTVGKVAKISGNKIYVALRNETQLREGLSLNVCRLGGHIEDPENGEVVGTEVETVARVSTEETNGRLLTATGQTQEIRVGDLVEISGDARVAVCPIRHENGEVSALSQTLRENITTSLVQNGVQLVERSLIDDVVQELDSQQSTVFDAKKSVEIGHRTGANLVVVSKIVSVGKGSKQYVRIVDVESSTVVFATAASVRIKNAGTLQPAPLRTPDSPSKVAWNLIRGEVDGKILGKNSALQFLQPVPPSYKLTIEFVKQGDDAVILMLPVGQTNVQLVLDNEHGRMAGLSWVDGKHISRNQTRKNIRCVQGLNTVAVAVKVDAGNAQVVAVLNGLQIINWSGKEASLSSQEHWIPLDRESIGVGTVECRLSLQNIDLRPLETK